MTRTIVIYEDGVPVEYGTLDTYVAPTPALFIGPTLKGTGDGSSWANQGNIFSINSFIHQLPPGGKVYFAADQGPYTLTDTGPGIYSGGVGDENDTRPDPSCFIDILGVNADLTPAMVRIVGDRTPFPTYPLYQADNEYVTSVSGWTPGSSVFVLRTGANYLHFDHFRFEHVGIPYNYSPSDPGTGGAWIHHIHLTNQEFFNVQRFQEMPHNEADFTQYVISYCLFEDIKGIGHSKACFRFRGGSHDWLFHNIDLDSARQDKDDFAVGIQCSDGARRAEVIDCKSINITDTTSGYWNGDGGSAERGNTCIYWENFISGGHTDASIDSKQTPDIDPDWLSGETSTYRLRAVHPAPIVGGDFYGSKKGLKIWDDLTCLGVHFGAPLKRGGSSGASQLCCSDDDAAAHQTAINCVFDGTGPILEINNSGSTVTLDSCVINNSAGTSLRSGAASNPHAKLVNCTGTWMDALRNALPDYVTPRFRSYSSNYSDGSYPQPSYPAHKEGDLIMFMGFADYSGTQLPPTIVSRFGEVWNIEPLRLSGTTFSSFIAWRIMDGIQYGAITATNVGIIPQAGMMHGAIAASFGGAKEIGIPFEDYQFTAATTGAPTTASGDDRTIVNWHACSNNSAFGTVPAGFTMAETNSTSIGGNGSQALLIKENVDSVISPAVVLGGGGNPTITHCLALIPKGT